MHIEPASLNIHDTYINISKQEDDRLNQMDLTCSGMLHVKIITMTFVNCSSEYL